MEKLKLAVQKSGRLHSESTVLLKECGIHIPNGNGQLKSVASNYPLEVFFLRDDDIPQYVEDGVADAGIVGKNIYLEKEKSIKAITELGFGHCRLSIAVPKNNSYNGIKDLAGIRIATSYPSLLGRYLEKNNIPADIHIISGSVEIAPGIGLADAICDLVSSGSTLLTNGLKEVETILESQAVLVANDSLAGKPQANIFQQLLFRIEAVRNASSKKYIMLNAPNESLEAIIRILPGMKSPTIVPLAEKGWSSVQSVVNEDIFWEVIEKLKALKAEGILVVPIEKMVI